jgi:hypothetical protein
VRLVVSGPGVNSALSFQVEFDDAIILFSFQQRIIFFTPAQEQQLVDRENINQYLRQK